MITQLFSLALTDLNGIVADIWVFVAGALGLVMIVMAISLVRQWANVSVQRRDDDEFIKSASSRDLDLVERR